MARELTDLEAALKHRYRTRPGGPFVPGVTTIIDVLEKGGLKWGAAGIAAEAAALNTRRKKYVVTGHRKLLASARGNTDGAVKKRTLANAGTDNDVYIHWARGEFDRRWRAKAKQGNDVHELAEAWSRGETIDVPDALAGYIDALERFYADYSPVFHLVECIVANPDLEYGGRFDLVAELHGPGADGLYMGDYKTGSAYVAEVALQEAGYMGAQLVTFDQTGAMNDLRALPPLAGARAIYLRPDGTYEVSDPFASITQARAWDAFVACRALYDYQQFTDKLTKEEE